MSWMTWSDCESLRRAAARCIAAAIAAIREHLTRGDLADGLIFDAVRVRLIEIGEAVKAIDSDLLATEPDVPWAQVAGMRDQLAHRYFDTSHAIVTQTVMRDLPELERAISRLGQKLRSHNSD